MEKNNTRYLPKITIELLNISQKAHPKSEHSVKPKKQWKISATTTIALQTENLILFQQKQNPSNKYIDWTRDDNSNSIVLLSKARTEAGKSWIILYIEPIDTYNTKSAYLYMINNESFTCERRRW